MAKDSFVESMLMDNVKVHRPAPELWTLDAADSSINSINNQAKSIITLSTSRSPIFRLHGKMLIPLTHLRDKGVELS